MIIYQAGHAAKQTEPVIDNRLLSFADYPNYLFKYWLTREAPKRLFIDSGAFSAETRGARIDIGRYCEFLLVNAARITVAASLDVISDWRASQKNYEYLTFRGAPVIPVYHWGEPRELLKDMCEASPYIAVGGLVGTKPNARWPFLHNVFNVAYPKTRVHLFRMTALDLLLAFPAYSADSSTAIVAGGRGTVHAFTKGRMNQKHYTKLARAGKSLTCADYIGAKNSAHLNRRIANIRAQQEMERHITDVWAARGVTFND